MHWMFARRDPADPDALVLVAKGGHNGEMHNQNDLGSIIVHHNGESLIVDPGRGRFSREYFGAGRYDLLVNQSFGHSCPVPNGQMQGPLTHVRHGDRRIDAGYHARLLEHRADDTQDLLRLELVDAWDEAADLESLARTVTFHRDCPAGRIELRDEVRFASNPGMLESVLITFGDVEEGEGHVIIRGERAALRVDFDGEALETAHGNWCRRWRSSTRRATSAGSSLLSEEPARWAASGWKSLRHDLVCCAATERWVKNQSL